MQLQMLLIISLPQVGETRAIQIHFLQSCNTTLAVVSQKPLRAIRSTETVRNLVVMEQEQDYLQRVGPSMGLLMVLYGQPQIPKQVKGLSQMQPKRPIALPIRLLTATIVSVLPLEVLGIISQKWRCWNLLTQHPQCFMHKVISVQTEPLGMLMIKLETAGKSFPLRLVVPNGQINHLSLLTVLLTQMGIPKFKQKKEQTTTPFVLTPQVRNA